MRRLSNKKLITAFFNILLLTFYSTTVFGVVIPSDVEETLTKVTRILLLLGTAVCIGKIIHIGVLYLTATAMEKSQAKQAILPWIIGTVICFGAATIGGAIIKIFTEGNILPSDVLSY